MGKIAEHFGQLPEGDRVRLALGELVDDAGEIPAWRARSAFLLAMNIQIPGFYRHLVWHRSLWEAFEDWRQSLEFGSDAPWDGPYGKRLRRVMGFSLAPWNLHEQWMMQVVLGVIDYMTDHGLTASQVDGGQATVPAGIPDLVIEAMVSDLVNAPINHPRLTFGGKQVGPDPDETIWPMEVFDPEEEFDFEWNPWLETRAENEAKAVAWFTARYRAAQDAREAETGGIKPARTGGRRFDHFEWTVRYQVLRYTYADIASDAGRSRQAVSEAVQEVLALIDLEPREPDRPGRKRQADEPCEEPDKSN